MIRDRVEVNLKGTGRTRRQDWFGPSVLVFLVDGGIFSHAVDIC